MPRRKHTPPPEGVSACEFMRHTWASGLPPAYQHGWLTRLIAERDGTQAALDFIAWYEAGPNEDESERP